MDEKIRISKLAGNSASVVGGILSVVGFGLAFVTAGASLSLLIAGGIIGAAGGVTSGGAALVNSLFEKKQMKRILEIYEKDKKLLEAMEKLSKSVMGLMGISKLAGILDEGGLAAGAGKAANMAKTGGLAGKSLFNSMKVASKAFFIIGGVVNIVMLPVDVYSVVKNSIELHKKTPSDLVKELKGILADLEEKEQIPLDENNLFTPQ